MGRKSWAMSLTLLQSLLSGQGVAFRTSCCRSRSLAVRPYPVPRPHNPHIRAFKHTSPSALHYFNSRKERYYHPSPISSRDTSSTLTRTNVWRMKVKNLRSELSSRGMDTVGNRGTLVTRLLGAVDAHAIDPIESTNPDDSFVKTGQTTYVLRTKGLATSRTDGTGIGLALYDTTGNRNVWSGGVYLPGRRTSFEAEYSGIILGMEYATNVIRAKNIVLESSNDAVVHQINGDFQVNRDSLKELLRMQVALAQNLDDFEAICIPNGDNFEAGSLANKALSTRKSSNIEAKWRIQDPMKAFGAPCTDKTATEIVEATSDEPISVFERLDRPGLSTSGSEAHSTPKIDSSKTYLLQFDGGSRGNPGTAGAGTVIYDGEGQEIWHGWKFHDTPATNNVAEYLGLLCGLQYAESIGIRQIVVEGDSQLIVKQLNGEYRVKEETLRKFYNAVVDTVDKFAYFEIRHIPRKDNSRADELANQAMDLKTSYGFESTNRIGL